MKEFLSKLFKNTIVRCALILVASVFVGLGLLYLVYCLPTTGEKTEQHMKETAETYRAEGTYPKNASKFSPAPLDNFTDALILAISADAGNPNYSTYEKALDARHPIIGTENDTSTIMVDHYLNGVEYTANWGYPRYWHGYQIITRPLIRFFNLHHIRILNMIIQMCVIVLVVYLMFKKNYKYLIFPLIITWFTLVPITVFKSLQYSSCFYCLMAAIIGIIVTKNHDDKKIIPLFLTAGVITAYFDFLTYPIIVLGIPAAIYLAIKNVSDIKENILSIIKVSIAWGIGYFGMWASKWLIAGPEVINSAKEEASLWTGSASDRITALLNNIEMFLDNKLLIFVVIFCTVIITLIVCKIKQIKKLSLKKELKNIALVFLPYLIIMMMPIVWYITLSTHSKIHYWFTFRGLAVVVFALMIGLHQVYRNIKK